MLSTTRKASVWVAVILLVLIVAVQATHSFILRHSDGYKAAVHFVRECPEIAGSLGKPLHLSFVQGRMFLLDEVPATELEIAATGERQKGNVYIRVLKRNGEWQVSATNLGFPDGTIMELHCN